MSNLERLKETLAAEAAAQVAGIQAEAERRARTARAEAEAKAAQIRAEAVAAAEREIALRQRQAEAEERLFTRQAILTAKAGLVEEVLAEARQRLAGLPEPEYRELLTRLIADSVPEGKVTVVLNRRDHDRLGQAFLGLVAGELAARGHRVELVLAPEPGALDGGAKLVGPDFEVDLSLGRLLERVADSLEPEVAKALFG